MREILITVWICLTILSSQASQGQRTLSGNTSAAFVYLYRHDAITSHPAAGFVDLDQVCSVHPEMFCVVEIEPGEHGIGQFSGPVGGGQKLLMLEGGKDYFFSFKPNNAADWGCAMLAGSCPDVGWRLMPEEVGRREIEGMKREEITVTPRLLARHGYFANDLGKFESIAVHLGDRVTVSFLYSLENRTGADYRMPDASSALLVRVSKLDDWRKDSELHLESPPNLPAGGKALLALTRVYDYSDVLSKGVEPTPKAIAAFLRERTRDLQMFFIVDPQSGRQMFFLNSSKLKDSEVLGRHPEYYTDLNRERKSCLAKYFAAIKTEPPDGAKSWPACIGHSVESGTVQAH
jgi:hypothetical protein